MQKQLVAVGLELVDHLHQLNLFVVRGLHHLAPRVQRIYYLFVIHLKTRPLIHFHDRKYQIYLYATYERYELHLIQLR